MKRIAFWKALQFNVYDLGNGRVLKKPKKKWQMFLVNLSWQPYLIFAPWVIIEKIKVAAKERSVAMTYFSSCKCNRQKLADLKIEGAVATQDKVTPLAQVLGKSISRDKNLVNEYVKFVFNCWEEGYSERVYKFVENYGVDRKGNLVLMDFGEMCFSKFDVKKTIESKYWKSIFSNKVGLSKYIRGYFYDQLAKSFTLKNLDKYWKK